MELVSLDVERFGRVAKASIGFKPGLNVLHGANEVGKSSIARAIRFALLLPHRQARWNLGAVEWRWGSDCHSGFQERGHGVLSCKEDLRHDDSFA